jgi:hypothetical protein
VLGALLLLTACTSAPVASPQPVARRSAYIVTADGRGADFRRTPGPAGERIRVLPDGSVLEATGREQRVDEQTWNEVHDSMGTAGWVLADSLSMTPPPLPTPTSMPVIPAPTPVPIPVLIPAPQVPVGPRPTDTPVPLAPAREQPPLPPLPPVPTARSVPAPQIPPVPAPSTPAFTDDDGG